MIPLQHYIIISALLFCIGLMVIVTKKNAIVVLMGIELMLNAANINLVAFSQFEKGLAEGQFFTLFIIVVAAAEAAVGLAIIIKVFEHFRTIELDQVKDLKD